MERLDNAKLLGGPPLEFNDSGLIDEDSSATSNTREALFAWISSILKLGSRTDAM